MSIRGNLKSMSVADLLQFLAAGRKTGTLKIGRGTIIKQIFLEEGLIVGSSSNDPKERLALLGGTEGDAESTAMMKKLPWSSRPVPY